MEYSSDVECEIVDVVERGFELVEEYSTDVDFDIDIVNVGERAVVGGMEE